MKWSERAGNVHYWIFPELQISDVRYLVLLHKMVRGLGKNVSMEVAANRLERRESWIVIDRIDENTV